MERELEALAARPESPGEPPFQALVEAAGGRGQVLLVGELWEREQSRTLLWDFARAVFPPHGRLWQFAHPRPLSLLQRGLAPNSKGKARAELRPARRQARLPPSRSLLLPGRER